MSSHSNDHNHNNRNRINHNTNPNRGRIRSSLAAVRSVEEGPPRKKHKKSSAHQGRDLQEKSHPLVQKRIRAFPNQSLLDKGNGKVYCQACNKSIGAEISTVKRHLDTLYLYNF